MKLNRLVLLTVTFLLLCAPVLAQDDEAYGRGRDTDILRLAAQLTQQSDALSRQVYNTYLSRTTNNQTDTQTLLTAYQLNASATIFRTMVNDRRRRSELRDAANVLSNLARGGNSYNTQANWSSVQRTVDDIQNELNRRGGGYPGNGDGYPGGNGSLHGTVRWRGTVDDVVQLNIQGRDIDPKALSGTPYNDALYNFSDALPNRQVNVTARKLRGRGDVRVVQQPSRFNDWTAIVEVRDSRSGADNYEVEINW